MYADCPPRPLAQPPNTLHVPLAQPPNTLYPIGGPRRLAQPPNTPKGVVIYLAGLEAQSRFHNVGTYAHTLSTAGVNLQRAQDS